MRLINTIEVAPYDYAKNEYELPNTTSALAPSEWKEFWLKCLTDSNLGGLKSIRDGSYLVDIETLKIEEIVEILKKELQNIEFDDFADQVEHLCGGVAIELGSEIVIEPSCCGDLGNLSDWENICDAGIGVWQQLWIGHPWIFYRRINNSIEFSEYSDLNLEDFKDIKAIYTIPEAALAEELRKMRRAQNDFADKVYQALVAIKNAGAKSIS